MGVIIDKELTTFKSNVNNVSELNSVSTALSDLFKKVIEYTTTCKEDLDKAYKSANSAVVLSRFDSLNTSVTNMDIKIADKLKSIIGSAEKVIESVGKLESLQKDIENLEKEREVKEANNESFDEGLLDNKINAFNELQIDALKMLATLKNSDGIAPLISV